MSLRPPSLRAIAAFEAAARHESFVKAANELNLTQSAISHSIRGLEERLGSRLFNRRGRSVILSEDGRALADRLRLSLLLLSQALDGMGATKEADTLVIAAPTSFASRVLLVHWRDMQSTSPSLQLELRTDLDVRAVQSGEADLCIDYGEGSYAGLASRVLGRDLIIPVVAPDHRPASDQLGECDLIENTEQSWALWFAQGPTPQPMHPPQIIVRTWSLAIDAAKAGLGVCLAPQSLVAGELRRGELVPVGAGAMPTPQAYHAVWRPYGPKIPLINQMLDGLLNATVSATAREREARFEAA